MKTRIICWFLAITLIFSWILNDVSVSAGDIETITFSVKYGQTDARKMADKLNQYRSDNGKGQLIYDYNLEKVAMQRAAEIVVRFDAEGENHYRPDGESYKKTIGDFGFDISPRGILYGENILAGTDDTMFLEAAFQAFCDNEKNRQIMLGDFVIFGVAHIHMDDKTDFWVQVFADEGEAGAYTSPYDGNSIASVKINPSIVEDVKVEYSSGEHTVATGNTVSVPLYIPKIMVIGSELKDPLKLSSLVFDSNDGYVLASNGTMTGIKEGTGSISANLLGRTFSYSITVTLGSGYIGPIPTQPVTSTPSPTQLITSTPNPTGTIVTWSPDPTDPVVTSTPAPTGIVVTWSPDPTQAVMLTQTVTPTLNPTQSVTPSPNNPTQIVTTTPSPTQAITSAPEPTQSVVTGLKVGDTFTEGKLRYKITSTTTVSVIALASGNATSISIPASVKNSGISFKVTKLEASAFENKTKLKTVKLGKNIKSIGAKAFKGCTTLTKITIPKKTTNIGKSTFYGCSKLKTITFSGTAKSIGKEAFAKINSKAVIKVPSSSYKKVKKLLDASGITCTVKKV